MGTRGRKIKCLGSRTQLVSKADILTTIYEPMNASVSRFRGRLQQSGSQMCSDGVDLFCEGEKVLHGASSDLESLKSGLAVVSTQT
jgi:hypothetical protein